MAVPAASPTPHGGLVRLDLHLHRGPRGARIPAARPSLSWEVAPRRAECSPGEEARRSWRGAGFCLGAATVGGSGSNMVGEVADVL